MSPKPASRSRDGRTSTGVHRPSSPQVWPRSSHRSCTVQRKGARQPVAGAAQRDVMKILTTVVCRGTNANRTFRRKISPSASNAISSETVASVGPAPGVIPNEAGRSAPPSNGGLPGRRRIQRSSDGGPDASPPRHRRAVIAMGTLGSMSVSMTTNTSVALYTHVAVPRSRTTRVANTRNRLSFAEPPGMERLRIGYRTAREGV